EVQPRGLKSAGTNRPATVFEVRVSRDSGSRGWSSSYGFPPREASARIAADAALDELCEIVLDRASWWRRVTAGMTEDEVEAMRDSPAVEGDERAAEWVG